MHTTKRAFVVLAALAFLLIATGASAQAQQAPSSSPASDSAAPAQPSASQPQAPSAQRPAAPAAAAEITVEGDLQEVDVKTNMITIKTSTGAEMKFKYDDSTKVTGGQKGVAGLATMTGSKVTAMYKKDGSTNTLTSIQVRPAAGAAPRTEAPAPRGVEPSTRPAEPVRPVDPTTKPAAPKPEN
jgi:hypothetical protein